MRKLLCILAMGVATVSANAQSEAYFLSHPALTPDGQTVVFSFEGDLLRVANESRKFFSVDEEVRLEVIAVTPIRFKLAGQITRQRLPGRYDVSV